MRRILMSVALTVSLALSCQRGPTSSDDEAPPSPVQANPRSQTSTEVPVTPPTTETSSPAPTLAFELPTGPPRPWDRERGSTMPDYAALNLDGSPFTLGEQRGHPLVLNFWATWCVPCREEFPALDDLRRRLEASGLRVVGVSLDSHLAAEEVRAFAERYNVDYTVVHDPENRAEGLFGVPPLPGNFVFDAEGRLVYSTFGGGPEALGELFAAARAATASP